MCQTVKKRLRSVFSLLLAAVLLLVSLPSHESAASASSAAAENLIRVGLYYGSLGLTQSTLTNKTGSGFELGYYNSGNVFTRLGAMTSTTLTLTVSGTSIVVTPQNAGEAPYTYPAAEYGLAVKPLPGSDGAKCVTSLQGTPYCGAFRYTVVSGKLTVVNYVDTEDYLKGVIPYEMSTSWPIEALKAQGVCARCFAVNRIGYHSEYDFDVCDSTCCQVYGGTRVATEYTDKAVDQTKGVYVLYDGQICQTFYHSSNGGATESSVNVWTANLPYLTGFMDAWDTVITQEHSSWSFTYTAAEITDILNTKGYSIGTVTAITPTYTEVGNIYALKFSDGSKTVTVQKETAANVLYSTKYKKYTYSPHFTIVGSSGSPTGLYVNSGANPLDDAAGAYAVGAGGLVSKVTASNGKVSVLSSSGLSSVSTTKSSEQSGTSYVVTGGGWGHNVGMSQYGARAMAQAGKNYDEILKYYFKGTAVGQA